MYKVECKPDDCNCYSHFLLKKKSMFSDINKTQNLKIFMDIIKSYLAHKEQEKNVTS